MIPAALSIEQAPAFSVPVRFFLTAPLFGVAAALLMLWNGPIILATRWSPNMLALTHLMTLGYLALIMVGAMIQLLAVLAGSPAPRSRAVYTGLHILLVLGVILLSGGFVSEKAWVFRFAVVVLGAGFGVFIVMVLWSLTRARASGPSVHGMGLALVALGVTLVLGLRLGTAYGWLAPIPRELTDLHVAWGLLGWIVLLVISVAFQVVPMFQITPDYPVPLTRWLVGLLLLGLVLWSGFGPLSVPPDGPVPRMLQFISSGVLACGLAIFAVVTLDLQRRRRRRVRDITLWYWRVAMVSLLACIGLWGTGQLLPFVSSDPRYEIALGVLFLVGFATSVVNGMLYKILPFLIWLHLSAHLHRQGKSRLAAPNMKQVIGDSQMWAQFRMQLFALLLMLIATLWPDPAAYPAGLVFALACLMFWWHLVVAARLYRRFLRAN